jgi:hypothetical protein
MRLAMASTLCGALCAAAAFAQAASEGVPPATTAEDPASLTVTVSPAEPRIGDRVQAEIILRTTGPATAEPRFPVWEERWGDAEVLAVEPARRMADGSWRQGVTLAIFETGPATLPAVEVQVPLADGTTRAARSQPLVVPVASILPQGGEEEVTALPPEPVRPLPAGPGFWWAVAGLALACTALGCLLWRASRRVREAVAALALSPIEAFTRALERLRREGDSERLFTGLSLELRRYIGRALGFPAAEGTTTEIQRRLRERGLPPDLVRETLELLREADRVKFARGGAERPRAERRLSDAERLADAVERWLQPPEAVASPEATA